VTGPTVSFGSPIEGKPFVLVVPTDHEDLAAYLTPEDLRVLVASGDAALVEHRQATCPHETTDEVNRLGEWSERLCRRCDLLFVDEGDGVLVPVEEGS
jgi:hypothetical protein